MSYKLTRFFEVVTKELDEGNNVDLIYLDFSKAFDKVTMRDYLKNYNLMAYLAVF